MEATTIKEATKKKSKTQENKELTLLNEPTIPSVQALV
jgi:hypothetical protein